MNSFTSVGSSRQHTQLACTVILLGFFFLEAQDVRMPITMLFRGAPLTATCGNCQYWNVFTHNNQQFSTMIHKLVKTPGEHCKLIPLLITVDASTGLTTIKFCSSFWKGTSGDIGTKLTEEELWFLTELCGGFWTTTAKQFPILPTRLFFRIALIFHNSTSCVFQAWLALKRKKKKLSDTAKSLLYTRKLW